jgi:hypothetical protein
MASILGKHSRQAFSASILGKHSRQAFMDAYAKTACRNNAFTPRARRLLKLIPDSQLDKISFADNYLPATRRGSTQALKQKGFQAALAPLLVGSF